MPFRNETMVRFAGYFRPLSLPLHLRRRSPKMNVTAFVSLRNPEHGACLSVSGISHLSCGERVEAVRLGDRLLSAERHPLVEVAAAAVLAPMCEHVWASETERCTPSASALVVAAGMGNRATVLSPEATVRTRRFSETARCCLPHEVDAAAVQPKRLDIRGGAGGAGGAAEPTPTRVVRPGNTGGRGQDGGFAETNSTPGGVGGAAILGTLEPPGSFGGAGGPGMHFGYSGDGQTGGRGSVVITW